MEHRDSASHQHPNPDCSGCSDSYIFERIFERSRNALQLINFLPYITTPVAVGIIFQLMFEWKSGVVNAFLNLSGRGFRILAWARLDIPVCGYLYDRLEKLWIQYDHVSVRTFYDTGRSV